MRKGNIQRLTFNVQRSGVDRRWIKVMLVAFLLLGNFWNCSGAANDLRSMILVIGTAGEPGYAERFSASAELWKQAAAKGQLQLTTIGENTNATEDRTLLLQTLTNEVARTEGELWLVLIGHGTFDGKNAKFNLRGPDVSSEDLAATLQSFGRPLVFVDCSSSSAPFLNALSASNRVALTATRSGYEADATRFGDYLARAIADPAADFDKDGQTSLLEACLMASRQVDQFYREAGRLATEHALLDDNGDKLGTPAGWFVGVRATRKAEGGATVDGIRAHQMHMVRGSAELKLSATQRARRDELEQKLNALRARKMELSEENYYAELENVLHEIAVVSSGN